ncbi:MAG: transporter substrate-binding domain-containing protein [Muribaculaceae bacterium]|nr:transporter substrate-binding domain-containing protein [Muribaculaceae bacterium]
MAITRQQPARRGQMLLYILLLAVVVACMVALSMCDKPAEGVGSQPSGGDTLDIAIEYSPVTYYTYNDTLGGYNYDLLRMISDSVHCPMKFHPVVTLEKALAGLEEGRYDVLVAQFPMTAGDTSRFAFTQPIYIDQQVLVQRRDSHAIHSQLDLAGDTVWVVKGSPMIQRIASLSREIGDTIYVHVDELYGPEQLMMMVSAGEIRYAVVNRSIARAMAAQLPNLDRSVAISLSQFQSWMVSKDRQGLCDSLNMWHNQVKRDTAAYLGLQRRYFGGTFPTLAR